MKQVDVPLTAPQKRFCCTSQPYPAIVGGLGSGKSRAGTMRLILLLLSDRGANGGYYMPSYDLLRLRAIPGVEDDLNMLGIAYTLNKSSFTITIHGYGDIIFRSYDRPERIVAYETAHSTIDEIDTLPIEKASLVWRKIAERNRQKREKPNTISVVTTPDQGVSGFVYDKWVKKKQPGYELIKAPTTSNPYLPPGYIDQIRANYDPVLADLYINGEFVSLSANKVYHFFDREACGTDRVITDSDTHLHISIDFNIGGCCATVTVYDGEEPRTVDEFTSHDTRDFINNLVARYPNKNIQVYPDASGNAERTNATASDIALIQQAGFSVNAPHKNPFVRDRINSVNGMISHRRWKVNVDKCPNLVHALETQGYTEKGEPEKFNTHPAIDDWTDSFGYFMHRMHPVIKPMTREDFNIQVY